jgi:hypothetical protein
MYTCVTPLIHIYIHVCVCINKVNLRCERKAPGLSTPLIVSGAHIFQNTEIIKSIPQDARHASIVATERDSE